MPYGGGGKGMGKAIATRFAAEGAKIIINSRSKTDLDNVKKEIQNNKGECSCFVGDITDLKTIQNLFLESKSKLGKLDILINCAGTVDFGSIESFPLNKFEKIMDLNVKSVFSCIQGQ